MTALEAVRAKGKAGLARALADIEARPDAAATAALLDEAEAAPRGHVLGLTGPPGVGKSTLTDALIRAFRARRKTVGVIAVDPSSRRSGGALLGDRTRMRRDPGDEGVFVRSMAARDRLGGLADLTYPSAVLMRALMDLVIVETVGVGQSETAIAEIADTVVFCAQPGSGDAIQYMKAGVMEIPDLVVVTKADMGEPARRTAADLKGALSLASTARTPPAVLSLSATAEEGIEALIEAIEARASDLDGRLAHQRRVQAEAWFDRQMAERFGREGSALLARSAAGAGSESHESGSFTRAHRQAAAYAEALSRAFAGTK